MSEAQGDQKPMGATPSRNPIEFVPGKHQQVDHMDTIYKAIYEFASSAGAFEGYVYQKTTLEAGSLDNWVSKLVKQYRDLPQDVCSSFQDALDRTMGRAVQSLIRLFGEDYPHVAALQTLIAGPMPDAPDDFEQEKKDKAGKYGN